MIQWEDVLEDGTYFETSVGAVELTVYLSAIRPAWLAEVSYEFAVILNKNYETESEAKAACLNAAEQFARNIMEGLGIDG